jgi:hypoxanthine phosphoribosyltransferase
MQVEFYTGINMKTKDPKVVIPLNADVKGLRVLVVDDVSDSGGSLQVALDHVKSRGASEVRVATLHIKPWTAFHPHYYAEEVDDWIVYPWEPLESIRNMSKRLKNDGFSQNDIFRRLLELGFNRKSIERAYGSSNT